MTSTKKSHDSLQSFAEEEDKLSKASSGQSSGAGLLKIDTSGKSGSEKLTTKQLETAIETPNVIPTVVAAVPKYTCT